MIPIPINIVGYAKRDILHLGLVLPSNDLFSLDGASFEAMKLKEVTFEAEMILEKSTGFPSWSRAGANSCRSAASLLFLPVSTLETQVGMRAALMKQDLGPI